MALAVLQSLTLAGLEGLSSSYALGPPEADCPAEERMRCHLLHFTPSPSALFVSLISLKGLGSARTGLLRGASPGVPIRRRLSAKPPCVGSESPLIPYVISSRAKPAT